MYELIQCISFEMVSYIRMRICTNFKSEMLPSSDMQCTICCVSLCKADFHAACRWINCGNFCALRSHSEVRKHGILREKAVRKCCFTYMKMDFFRLRNIPRSKSVEDRKPKVQSRSINIKLKESINHQSTPRNQSSHRRLPVRYSCLFVHNAYSWLI